MRPRVRPAAYFALIEGVLRFTDVTEGAGLKGCKAGRVSWSDIDGDGLPDLVMDGRYIFLNKGDGAFKDMTETSGVKHEFASGGMLTDFDDDGFPDLLAFTSRNGPRLYINKSKRGSHVRQGGILCRRKQ